VQFLHSIRSVKISFKNKTTDMSSSSKSSWKASVNRAKNCRTLYTVMKSLFYRSLPDNVIVKAAEDMEYKLMISNDNQEMFQSDLSRTFTYSTLYNENMYYTLTTHRCCCWTSKSHVL